LIGVSLAPSINAYISKISLDDEIIEYTIEICGMNGGKQKVTLSLDSETYHEFQKHCEENAIMLSKKIELFMKKEIEENK